MDIAPASQTNSPTNLRKVPASIRARLRVFYRWGADKLVVSWLRSNGFANVTEIPPDTWIEIEPDIRFMCGTHNDDSWLAIRFPWGTLLNVNDCVLEIRVISNASLVSSITSMSCLHSSRTRNGRAIPTITNCANVKLTRARAHQTAGPHFVTSGYCALCEFRLFLQSGELLSERRDNLAGDVAEFIETELGREQSCCTQATDGILTGIRTGTPPPTDMPSTLSFVWRMGRPTSCTSFS